MNSLFESISNLNVENDFALQFRILGIEKGWEIIDKLECDEELKRKLVKYVTFAYSYESPLLRKKKERRQNKENILSFLQIEPTDFVLECIENKNKTINEYITWWLRESQDRDFQLIISAEDLLHSLLEVARSGIDKVVTAKDEKQVEKATKLFYKSEVVLRADAFEKAMEIKSSIEKQIKVIERNYEYLSGVVKKEIPNSALNMNWQEVWAHKYAKRK